jgi:hypothetical protein
MTINRRKFIGSSAALAACSVIPASLIGKTPAGSSFGSKTSPNSKFGGVQIGAITYSWRSMPSGVDNVIKYCNEANISSIELMSTDLEEFLGAPKNPMQAQQRPLVPAAPAGQPATQQQGPPPPPQGGRRQMTPEQQEMMNKYNSDLKAWRVSLPMSKVAEAKKLFDNAGIKVHIVKFSPSRWSDEEIDYAFNTAKAMGAKGVTDEISEEAVKKLGPIAEKHGMFAIFHNHMQFATPGFSYDPFLAVSPAVMMNFDAGHFYGSTGIHPNTIIEKYHDRIISVHIKDKTGPKTTPPNTNQVWGQGEMPLADVLLLIKKNKWPINCDIELEYEVKPWSNAVKETQLCVNYARQILA